MPEEIAANPCTSDQGCDPPAHSIAFIIILSHNISGACADTDTYKTVRTEAGALCRSANPAAATIRPPQRQQSGCGQPHYHHPHPPQRQQSARRQAPTRHSPARGRRELGPTSTDAAADCSRQRAELLRGWQEYPWAPAEGVRPALHPFPAERHGGYTASLNRLAATSTAEPLADRSTAGVPSRKHRTILSHHAAPGFPASPVDEHDAARPPRAGCHARGQSLPSRR